VPERTAKEYPALAEKSAELTRALEAQQLPVLDALSQFYGGDTHELRKASYLKALRELKPGVSEIIIHCGIDNDELRAITNSSANRDGDRRIFTDPDVMAEIKRLEIEVISWKQFRELAAKSATAR
jgi:hypothetical protein